MINTREIGYKGETLAKKYVEGKGYEIIKLNYTSRKGEIDIIAMDGNILVFLEVKLRRNLNFGRGIESINIRKANRIKYVAYDFIKANRLEDYPIRFDVVDIISFNGKNKIYLIKEAFY